LANELDEIDQRQRKKKLGLSRKLKNFDKKRESFSPEAKKIGNASTLVGASTPSKMLP